MSDFRAIAGVSTTLQTLLRDRMELPAGVSLTNLLITISTPHPEAPQNNLPATETPRVNLFLYAVSENAFLKNQDLRASPGAYGEPPLSLNLHYLVTAYGATQEATSSFVNESQAQQLLGSAMRVLHDYPTIPDALMTVRAPIGQTILHASLRREFERLKICLDPLSLEDLTKIWTSLTIPYRASAAYSVSVVQIESRRTRRFPQLVGEPAAAGPAITVIPLQTPFIQTLAVRRQTDPPDRERSAPYARIGDTLIIRGMNFSGGTVTVSLNGTEIPVIPVSPQRIELLIPDDQYTYNGTVFTIPPEQRLQPGVQDVDVAAIPPGLRQMSARSNRAVMMLTPHVQMITSVAPRTLTLSGTRLFADELEGETLIGRVLYTPDAYDSATPTSIQLTLPDALPFRSVNASVTDGIGGFPALGGVPEVDVSIGGAGPFTVTFPTQPTDFAEAAAGLQAAIRTVNNPLFQAARVAAQDNRFVVVPGGLEAAVAIGGTDAPALGLDAASTRQGYLSGALDPFLPLSTPPGAFTLSVGAVTADVALASAPVSVSDAADVLRDAITNADPSPEFANALVVALGAQLLIIPGVNAAVTFAELPGVDETTVAELQLRADYPVRVRVNGAEGIGGANRVELPL